MGVFFYGTRANLSSQAMPDFYIGRRLTRAASHKRESEILRKPKATAFTAADWADAFAPPGESGYPSKQNRELPHQTAAPIGLANLQKRAKSGSSKEIR
jgi:hypothetical protein